MTEPQTVIARLSPSLVRRAQGLVDRGGAYESLSELIAIALENQLALEDGRTANSAQKSGDGTDAATERLLILPSVPPSEFAPPARNPEGLSAFTNRLFPLMLACRVLANSPPDVRLADYHRAAAAAARSVGLRLKLEDSSAGRRGLSRRWIALPVGNKGDATLARFIHHFTITATRTGEVAGPLAALGLVNLAHRDRPVLTSDGWELARQPNPVLDGEGSPECTLSQDERSLLGRCIARNEREVRAIEEFAELVARHAGQQDAIDASLRGPHGWSKDQAGAHRAGMVGRLHDLGLVQVDGEGPNARIRLQEGLLSRLVRGET